MTKNRLRRLALRMGWISAAALWLAGCSGMQIVDALVPRDGYRAETAIAYGSEPRQKLDVYRPTEASARPPIVVFFYGGSWSHGNRGDYRFVGEALATGGAIVVVPDYRLSPEVKYPTFLQDSAKAVRWAFDHATALGGDPTRIFVMGHSAGGYNAAEMALDKRWLGAEGIATDRLAGWIGLAGPYNFLPIVDRESQVAFNWPDTPRDSQPIFHAGPGAPRSLLIAANGDRTVDPDRNTAALADKLRTVGADVTLQRYDRVNHVTLIGSMATPLRFLAPVREEVLRFLGLAAPVG